MKLVNKRKVNRYFCYFCSGYYRRPHVGQRSFVMMMPNQGIKDTGVITIEDSDEEVSE